MRRARLALLGGFAAGCTGVDVGTSPYAHETPPPPPPLVRFLDHASYLGGSGFDQIEDAVRWNDGVIVVGGTASPDFPTTDGTSVDLSTPAGCSACPFDGFVAFLGPDGTPRWIKLLSTPGYDRLTSVVVAGSQLFVGGSSGQRAGLAGWHGGTSAERGEQDGLLCALDPRDGYLQSCRYLGGSGAGGITDLATTPDTDLVVAALAVDATEALHLDAAYSAAFAGAARATSSSADGVVVVMSRDLPAADNLRWASYVGGSGDEDGVASLLVDDSGIAYLGNTTSSDVPTPDGAITTAPMGGNVFLTVLSLDGTTVDYGSYVGGAGDDRVGPGALVGSLAALTVGISTSSRDLASTPPYGGDAGPGCGSGDVWLGTFDTRASGSGSGFDGRYLGGRAGDRLGALGQGGSSFGGARLLVAGDTYSNDFPVQSGAQAAPAGSACGPSNDNADAFATALEGLVFVSDSTYLGGAGFDRAVAILGGSGALFVVGNTRSVDFPVVRGADSSLGGAQDGFVARYGSGDPPIGPGPGPDAAEPEVDDESAGCCGTARAPAPAMLALAGLVLMMLVRRRRGR